MVVLRLQTRLKPSCPNLMLLFKDALSATESLLSHEGSCKCEHEELDFEEIILAIDITAVENVGRHICCL